VEPRSRKSRIIFVGAGTIYDAALAPTLTLNMNFYFKIKQYEVEVI
jgi:hypothetical protein